MKLGIVHVPRAGFRETVEAIAAFEREGFDRAWLPDQPFFLDPYPLLGAASLATRRIGLGLGITNASTAHPVIIARAAATLADAAAGRFVVGLGSGNRRDFLDPLGLKVDRAAERCGKAVRIIQQLLAGEVVDHRSEFFHVDGVRLSFVPTRAPVYVAGIGPKMLETAGAVADGVIVQYASEQLIAFALRSVHCGAERAGRTMADVVVWSRAVVTRDRDEARKRLKPRVAHSLGHASQDVFDAIGVPAARRLALQEAYASGGPAVAAEHVSDAMTEHFAWIGTEDEILERLMALRSLPVSEAVILLAQDSPEELLDVARRLASRPARAALG